MIERGTLGGTCVNTVRPVEGAHRRGSARHVAVDAATRFLGIASTDPVDMPALIAGKQALVESLRGEYADVADSYGWQVLRGDASFVGTLMRRFSMLPEPTEASRPSRPTTTWSRLVLARGYRRSTAWRRPDT